MKLHSLFLVLMCTILGLPKVVNANEMTQPSSQMIVAGAASPAGETTPIAVSNSETTTTVTPGAVTSSAPFSGSSSPQTGVIQVNNASGLSGLTYPNCGGTCAFAITRVTPMSNGNTGLEAVAGLVWQFSSPEKTIAKSQQLLFQAQSDQINDQSTLMLAEKLAEAIETGKLDRANLLAMVLAKRLGYSDHRQLLQSAKNR